MAASLAAAAAFGGAPGAAGAPHAVAASDIPSTQLISRSLSGSLPDAPSTQPAISHDGRIARVAAFVSAATDLVTGPTGGRRNVFLTFRARPWAANGTPWIPGRTVLASAGRGGAAPDGPSWGPALDGDDAHAPHCVAFVSAASNLVAGDRDRRSDAFVRSLSGGRMRRISGPGPVSAVSVDGRCRHVAYVAGGTVYVTTLGGRTRRLSPRGGAGHPRLAGNGSLVAWTRRGRVYAARLAGRVRRLGPGAWPVVDGYGRYVVYERAGTILERVLATRRTTVIAAGTHPDVTSGGHFIFYVAGGLVRVNISRVPVSRRSDRDPIQGTADEPATSPHGNYALFTCDDPLTDARIAPTLAGAPGAPQVYMRYLGPR